MNIKLKITSFLTAVILGLNTYAYASIYDIVDTNTISKGVIISNINRLDESGWLNINIAEIDLSNENLSLKLLKNESDLKKMQNVKTFANNFNTEVAINGDFFARNSSNSSEGTSVGVEISDGNLLSSPADDFGSFAVFMQNNDGNSYIDYINSTMIITAPNGEIAKVRSINKFDDKSQIAMYTTNWGANSPGSTGNLVEAVIEDGIITSINYDMGPYPIPENGYILSFLQDHTRFILDNFSVGDKVIFETAYEFDFSNVNLALGGGTILVKDGQKAPITHNITGNNPRTALGISSDGKKVYFITVDGRQAISRGVTLSYLADLLIEYGIYNAINLDGGGSTTMVAKSFGSNENNVVNSPSESSLRLVTNGIGAVNTSTDNTLNSIVLQPENDKTFVYSPIKIDAVGVDSQLRKSTDLTDITFTVSDDNGYIENGYYYPMKAGDVIIEAQSNGVRGALSLKVLDMPDMLKLNDKEVSLNVGDTYYIDLKGILNDGTSAPISPANCGVSVSDNILDISGNTITATKEGTSIITFSYGDVSTSMLLRVNSDAARKIPDDVKRKDPAQVTNMPDTANSFKFAVFGNAIYRNTLLERAVSKRLNDELGKNNIISFYVGDKILLNQQIYDYGNNVFLSFANEDGSLSINDLAFLKASLENTTAENVFILMSDKPNLTQNEEKVFNGLLNDNSHSKNIYVIYNGIFEIAPIDNIKYFSVNGVEAILETPDALDLFYILFNVENGNLTYEIKSLY